MELIHTPKQETVSWIVRSLNHLFEILSIYGFPLFILVVLGFLGTLLHWRKIQRGEIIILSFTAAFFFIMSCVFTDPYPQTKHIIAIVPLLALFSAKAMETFFVCARSSIRLKSACFGLIFIFSFVYSFKGVSVFRQGDTRHASTEWILKHAPPHATIEVFNQLNYAAKTTLMKNYDIVYLVQHSKGFQGKHFFKWNRVAKREAYLRRINQTDSISDFILITMNDISKLNNPRYMDHIPGVGNYLKALFEKKKNYDIVAVSEPKNKKIMSHLIPGWIHSENIFWPPIPSYTVTSNTIYIFKRRSKHD